MENCMKNEKRAFFKDRAINGHQSMYVEMVCLTHTSNITIHTDKVIFEL